MVITPPAVSRPRESGATSRSRMSVVAESAWLVRVVAFFYIAADVGQHRAWVIIERDADKSTFRGVGFFFKTGESAGIVHGDDPVFFGFFQ